MQDKPGRSMGSDKEIEDKARQRKEQSPESELRSQDRGLDDGIRPGSQYRTTVWNSGRVYRLRQSEIEAITEIGRFRIIDEKDLVRFHYRGDRSRSKHDLKNLVSQRLVRRIRLLDRAGRPVKVLVLTREGKRLLERNTHSGGSRGRQKLYSGFAKPAEAFHDSAIYRMYQAEARKIRSAGGTIKKVVLDYELKAKVYGETAKATRQTGSKELQDRHRIASEHGLPVVQGKIAFPDLRVEYETREGDRAKVDLELASEHYRGAHIARKIQAGFKVYVSGSSKASGSAVKEERELTAGLLSL